MAIKPGRQFEQSILGIPAKSGKVHLPPGYPSCRKSERRRRSRRHGDEVIQLSFEAALQDAMCSGRLIGKPDTWENLKDEKKRLYWLVLRRFPKSCRRLMMYSTVGTALDFYHGTDLLFSLNGNVATIDLSLRADKVTKANFLLSKEIVDDRPRLEELMEQVARRLDRKLNITRRAN